MIMYILQKSVLFPKTKQNKNKTKMTLFELSMLFFNLDLFT